MYCKTEIPWQCSFFSELLQTNYIRNHTCFTSSYLRDAKHLVLYPEYLKDSVYEWLFVGNLATFQSFKT